jgi:dimethylamine monooxygenase subunit A
MPTSTEGSTGSTIGSTTGSTIAELFAAGQWRLAMGLRPLSLEAWIDIGSDFVDQLTQKTKLLTQRYSDVFADLPGSEAAQQEVLELLVAHLLHYFPQHYRQQEDCIINQTTEQRWQSADFLAHPLDLAARLVQEDLCLMLPSDSGYVLAAASVCFPSRWQMSEKIGRPLAEIHQPVPGYDAKLARPVDQFFQRLRPAYPGYRFNWSLVDSPELFLPVGHNQVNEPTSKAITAEDAGERLWLRTERQTFRRLPISNGVLFTIRTAVHPLHIIATNPIAQNLAAMIHQMPLDTLHYKSILPFRTALLEYLERNRT